MTNLQLMTATEIGPRTYTAECPTTHEVFVADRVRRQSIGMQPVVWMLCPLCDALLNTGDAYDLREPQWHLFLAGQVKP